MDWLPFLRRSRPDLEPSTLGFVLCLDPGETTGWALWFDGNLAEVGQEQTGTEPANMLMFIKEMDEQVGLSRIVYEEYRVRGNKFREHVGSEVVTIQHIGAIRAAATLLDIPLWKQAPGIAKGFATDSKLKLFGLWQPGKRHANDAIRHGVYWHLFVAGRKR